MKPRTASRLAWSVGTLSSALIVGALLLMFIDRHSPLPSAASAQDWSFSNVLNAVVGAAVPAIAILLVSRRPENTIGWLFLAAGLIVSLSGFALSYAVHALVADPGSVPAGRAFAWFGNGVSVSALGLLAFVFLLFPRGHLPSQRWRPAAWFVAGAFALFTVFTCLGAAEAWSDPFGPPPPSAQPPSWLLPLLFVAFAAALALPLAAVVARFRGSTGDERLQLKWFVTAAALVVVVTLVSSFLPGSNSTPAVLSVLSSLSLVFLWVAIAVAVLKYHLYDIDIVISKALVYGVLTAFLVAVYVAIVVGIGAAIGSAHNSVLTVLAAAVIAFAFNPVRTRATRLANRVVYGKRASPYQVLSQFSDEMAGSYALEDVLARMAAILGEGTGARQARVWLRVGHELRPAASWGESGAAPEPLPSTDGELPEIADASKVVAVRHHDELLGALAVTKPQNEPLTAAESKLVDDLAAQAGLVLRNVRLIEDLRASRQRLVAAQDQERRRLERNIHDGAQQQLVAIAVKASLAGSLVGKDADRERAVIDQLKTEATEALENLRDLARGIYPPLLSDQGLAAALQPRARRSPIPVVLESDGIGRYQAEAEAAVYFSVLEGLQNIAKYAEASRAVVRLGHADGRLWFEVSDDGRGFDADAATYGTGLQGIADRLEALDGTLDVRSVPGQGTTLLGAVPVRSTEAPSRAIGGEAGGP
jgi:signal transduction histidine kinase